MPLIDRTPFVDLVERMIVVRPFILPGDLGPAVIGQGHIDGVANYRGSRTAGGFGLTVEPFDLIRLQLNHHGLQSHMTIIGI